MEDLELPLARWLRGARNCLKFSLIIGMNLTWVQVSRVNREPDIWWEGAIMWEKKLKAIKQSTCLVLGHTQCSDSWHGNQDLGQKSSWLFQRTSICHSLWVYQKIQEGFWDVQIPVEFTDSSCDMCGISNTCDQCDTI